MEQGDLLDVTYGATTTPARYAIKVSGVSSAGLIAAWRHIVDGEVTSYSHDIGESFCFLWPMLRTVNPLSKRLIGLCGYSKPKEVKLNEEYTAVVADGVVTVGCQKISFHKVLELAEVVKQQKGS